MRGTLARGDKKVIGTAYLSCLGWCSRHRCVTLLLHLRFMVLLFSSFFVFQSVNTIDLFESCLQNAWSFHLRQPVALPYYYVRSLRPFITNILTKTSYGTLLGTQFFQVWLTGTLTILFAYSIDLHRWHCCFQSSSPSTVLLSATKDLPNLLWTANRPSRHSRINLPRHHDSPRQGSFWSRRHVLWGKPMGCTRANSHCFRYRSHQHGLCWTSHYQDHEGEKASGWVKHDLLLSEHYWFLFTETKDGKKSYDPAPHSKEMQALNRAFGRMHGISSLVNLTAFLATVWYGFTIAGRLQ